MGWWGGSFREEIFSGDFPLRCFGIELLDTIGGLFQINSCLELYVAIDSLRQMREPVKWPFKFPQVECPLIGELNDFFWKTKWHSTAAPNS